MFIQEQSKKLASTMLLFPTLIRVFYIIKYLPCSHRLLSGVLVLLETVTVINPTTISALTVSDTVQCYGSKQ